MTWRKLGLVWKPDAKCTWAKTHALLPTPLVLGELVRVYFAAVDSDKFGRVGYVDVLAAEPTRVVRESRRPVLDLGASGTFDDSGVTPSCLLSVGSELWMYYVGWQRAGRVPYMLFTGLARSRDGGESFERASSVPVIDRSHAEPYSRGAPFVMREGEGKFRAWYWSSRGWAESPAKLHYNNDILHVESSDGIHWPEAGTVCVARRPGSTEFSLGRPWVMNDGRDWKMWYTIRSHSDPDAAGLALSSDGKDWQRCDDLANLPRSDAGWDSEMICYPAVVRVGGRLLLFYNGNRHGETGFGVAEAKL